MGIGLKSALDINESFIKGEVSAEEVVKVYIKRIYEEDKYGAFLYVDEKKAISKAKLLDEKRKRGEKTGRLAAVPIAVKDNIAVKDMPMTCGSKILKDYISPYDASIIEKIKMEDGIIIGKTNMDEFAMGYSGEYSAFETIKNPRNMEKSPGGSSGGSAAAVAADLVPLALGTDTGGSVRQPSAFCGVVGFKPGYGQISRYGLAGFSSSLDTVGIVSKKIQDAVLLYNSVYGKDLKDDTSVESRSVSENFLNMKINGGRIFYIREMLQVCNKDVLKLFFKNLELIRSFGIEVKEVSLPLLQYSLPAYLAVSSAEASSNLARYDGIRYGMSIRSDSDLYSIYKKSRSVGLGKEVKKRIILGSYLLWDKEGKKLYERALKVREDIKEAFYTLLKENSGMISPCTSDIAFGLKEKRQALEMYNMDRLTVPVSLAGVPGISVPCGTINGMPLGIQIITAEKNLDFMFRLGLEIEKNVVMYYE